jgi:glycosyltransferase involved in cell wall biosynthesis
LGAWFRARGDDVVFLAHPPAQGGNVPPAREGVRWIPRRRTGTGVERALRIDSYKAARAIGAALDGLAKDADLLHLHSNGLIVEAAARWATRAGVPYVLTLYGTEIWHFRRRWPIDPFVRAYRGASAVTFYSDRLRERARELGLHRPGLSTIYPAVGDAFTPADRTTRDTWRRELGIAEPIVVLNVKRLHELAGQKYLIDAFAKIARGRRDIRLAICGTGPLRQDLESQARECGVADQITFAGLVPNPTVARYAAIADVFALPSILEALPTVAVEALACGTPVISADHPGGLELHELFGDDVVVTPKGNVDRLAAALADALAAPRRAQARSLDIVAARFRRAAIEAAYADVYARSIETARRRQTT